VGGCALVFFHITPSSTFSSRDYAEYICPKCNHFNPSARFKKRARGSSPLSPSSLSPNPSSGPTPRKPIPDRQTPPQEGLPRDPDTIAQAPDTSMMEIDNS